MKGRPNRPLIEITINEFSINLNKCLTKPFTNETKLRQFYTSYLCTQQELTLNWIEKYGYDKVEDWCERYFNDWDFDKHSTILKSKFLIKYNNIMPIK